MSGVTLLERKRIWSTLARLDHPDCVVLVGSVARGTRIAATGDVDILIVNGAGPKTLSPGIQVTMVSADSFADRVFAGDDFAQWALRFGKPIHGRLKWDELKSQLLGEAPWPAPETKRKHAAKRLARARELLEMNDLEAATEELGYAGNHLARALLLMHQVFPMSRPELPDQLRQIQETDLAALLERLYVQDDLELSELAEHVTQLDHWLSD